MSRSNWTGRTNRTLDQAFGPYCAPYVQDISKRSRRAEAVFVLACLACGALGLLVTYWGIT